MTKMTEEEAIRGYKIKRAHQNVAEALDRESYYKEGTLDDETLSHLLLFLAEEYFRVTGRKIGVF
tara:strand:- start:597 stop:791 length:195 start_codon:yes stop_codon:yes gene_type:complete